MEAESIHTTHPLVANRLKRAGGHLKNVIDMIERDSPCLDIAQQLHAVERAIGAAKRTLIHDHLDHCLSHALEAGNADARRRMDEFKDITKYL